MDLYKLTAHELADMLRKKEVSSTEITKSLLDRIESVEDKIKSYVTVTGESALETAAAADRKIAAGEELLPLEGIPAGIKDNICIEGTKTTCASKMLENFVPPYDAYVIKKLKKMNVPVLGKLNMDEFAMGSSTEKSYFHNTHNPYDLGKVPGGSSGGSAAGVCADEAVYSLGSDTGGSIRQPASYCGVVGLKPTYGLVSRFGLVAFASSLDQIGPLTKDVTDSAMVLNAIVGYDPLDSTSVNIKHPDYTKALINDAKGLKIGVPEDYMGEGTDPEVKEAILNALETYKRLGAEVEYFKLAASKYALPAYYIISSAEASSNLARYDGIKYGYRTENYNDLTSLYKNTRSEGFGKEVKRRIMLGTYALSSGFYDAYYKKAQQVRTIIRNDFENAFSKYDVILTPTSPRTAFAFGEKSADPVQMYLEDICTVSSNIAGIPALSMPCGVDKGGMPIGLHLIGPAFGEETIFRAAYTFEQNTDFHKTRPAL